MLDLFAAYSNRSKTYLCVPMGLKYFLGVPTDLKRFCVPAGLKYFILVSNRSKIFFSSVLTGLSC